MLRSTATICETFASESSDNPVRSAFSEHVARSRRPAEIASKGHNNHSC